MVLPIRSLWSNTTEYHPEKCLCRHLNMQVWYVRELILLLCQPATHTHTQDRYQPWDYACEPWFEFSVLYIGSQCPAAAVFGDVEELIGGLWRPSALPLSPFLCWNEHTLVYRDSIKMCSLAQKVQKMILFCMNGKNNRPKIIYKTITVIAVITTWNK